MTMIVTFIMSALQNPPASGDTWWLPLLNYGVLGIVAVALGFVCRWKDKRVDQIQEQRIKENADQAERYRLALVDVVKTLDATLKMVSAQKGAGGGS